MNKAVMTLALAAGVLARADFSYTSTQSGMGGNSSTKHYLKGQKMMIDTGRTATILDFEAQTITMVNNTNKTYRVMKFADAGAATPGDVQVDVKSTGQKKTVNGFNASEVVMTVQTDNPARPDAGKIRMEMHLWVSPDVPGVAEQRAFYQKNRGNFPWAAMARGANPSMQKAMADMQRKMAELNGVPVLETVKMNMGGGGAGAPDRSAQMAQARAQLEEMQKQGGPQAQAAAQALARMGAVSGGGGSMETTMESSNFSTASIPDSTFAIPAGYRRIEQ